MINLTYTLTEKIGGNVIFHLYFNNILFLIHPFIDFWLKLENSQYFFYKCIPVLLTSHAVHKSFYECILYIGNPT